MKRTPGANTPKCSIIYLSKALDKQTKSRQEWIGEMKATHAKKEMRAFPLAALCWLKFGACAEVETDALHFPQQSQRQASHVRGRANFSRWLVLYRCESLYFRFEPPPLTDGDVHPQRARTPPWKSLSLLSWLTAGKSAGKLFCAGVAGEI
jgi:hypothetical protein